MELHLSFNSKEIDLETMRTTRKILVKWIPLILRFTTRGFPRYLEMMTPINLDCEGSLNIYKLGVDWGSCVYPLLTLSPPF